MATVTSVAGEGPCKDLCSNGHNEPQTPFGFDVAAAILYGDSPEINSSAGSLVEHLKSVKVQQLYDQVFFSTMLLHPGS
ncbi:unnamed protein product [Pleuronectes platessa]|uniref:Uncharacterized protein n=2 Tax=Pleuronectes platessa TaxID=8262 RepID=A0A9N7VLB8_PLEPL|nr:unnamed protein product [Pleuronectes platessa]